jgi:hypothetical protein
METVDHAVTGPSHRPLVSGDGSTAAAGGRRRRSIGVGAVLAPALLLIGCAAGQQAETSRETPDVAGVSGGVGQMVLDDVFVDSGSSVGVGARRSRCAACSPTTRRPPIAW